MDRPEEKFSHEELVQLLQRSVTLQERDAEKLYTESDLLSAARELGVSPEVMKKALAEHRARALAKRAAPRPFDTKIELDVTDSVFELRVPPLRVGQAQAVPLGFTTTWIGFIGFWTWGASRASFLFAAFSLPFWLAGIGMAKRFVAPLFRRTTLRLERNGAGVLVTGPFRRRRPLDVSALRVRETPALATMNAGPIPSALFLDHGTETLTLLEGFSDAEVLWVREELRAWLPEAGEP
ncbi:MAG TPA: hypothetical protein VHE30_23010 [Polyangiaceae bacterium]|nr:hypothetical protein [Polyangiaceae bacterium]